MSNIRGRHVRRRWPKHRRACVLLASVVAWNAILGTGIWVSGGFGHSHPWPPLAATLALVALMGIAAVALGLLLIPRFRSWAVSPNGRVCVRAGDYFTIPLGDSGDAPLALGQVLSVEPQAMNSYGCAFWPSLEGDATRQLTTPPAVVTLVTPELIKSRKWQVKGNVRAVVPAGARRYEAFRRADWVGAKIVGSGNIRTVLRAFHGLEYWDQYADPDYMTKLLQPGSEIPKNARFKSSTTPAIEPTCQGPLRAP